MKLSRLTETLFVLDLVLVLILVLVLATPFLDFREYGSPPEPDREWRDMVAEMEGFSGTPFRDSIDNTRAFRTMRSVPVKRRAGAIEDYEVTGHGNGRVYFVHTKTGALAGYSEGDTIEDYLIVRIGEDAVELEKDGERIELVF